MYHQTQTASREEFKFLCVIVLLFFIHYNVYLLGHRIQLMPVSDYMGINWFLSSQTSINLLIYNRLNTAQLHIYVNLTSSVEFHCTSIWQLMVHSVVRWIFRFSASSHCAPAGFKSLCWLCTSSKEAHQCDQLYHSSIYDKRFNLSPI